jgi:membrane-bound lytic murein transglycosylase C
MGSRLISVLAVVAVSTLAASAWAQSNFEEYKEQRNTDFEAYKKTIEEQFAAFKAIHLEEAEKYQAEVSEEWEDPDLSTRTSWVEYSDDLTERTKVDFETETITIEVRNPESAEVSEDTLREELTKLVTKNRAEAFADDVVAQAVERRSRTEIEDLQTAEVEPDGILLPYLTGSFEAGAAVVTEIVDHMVSRATRTSAPGTDGRTVRRVEVPLTVPEQLTKPVDGGQIPAQLPRKARSFWIDVNNFAGVAEVEPSLVYAVIESESSFNPLAKSHVPAYGLMQIVPASAGKDATAKLFGQARVLSPSYLYNTGNNIEIGATYLNILYYKYLSGIKDPRSRLYCSIAAYNTGAGNVARAFTGQKRIQPAVEVINRMTPQQVYSTLVTKLPYHETRRYLQKVTTKLEKYQEMGV